MAWVCRTSSCVGRRLKRAPPHFPTRVYPTGVVGLTPWSGRSRGDAEPETERAHDLLDRPELRVAVSRQRLVETLATESCLTCDLSHPLRASDIAECRGEQDDEHLTLLLDVVAIAGSGR